MLPDLFKNFNTTLGAINPALGAIGGLVGNLGQKTGTALAANQTKTTTPQTMGVKAVNPQPKTSQNNTLPASQTQKIAAADASWPNPTPPAASASQTPTNSNTGLYGQLINMGKGGLSQYWQDLFNYNRGLQNINAGRMTGALDPNVTRSAQAYAETYGPALQSEATALGVQHNIAAEAAPVAVPYSTQFTNPVTGEAVSNPGNPQSVVQDLAQKLATGTGGIDYNTAYQQLSGFGPVIQNSLLPAIQALNPNFRVNQSVVNAQVQGQLAPAAQNAQNQLTNLQNTLNSAPAFEKTVIPAINKLYGYISQNTGLQAGGTQALQSAITDARAAMANALGAANNATPSTYDAYVQTLIPDGITPAQLTNAIQQFNAQIQGKLGAFANPGTTVFQGAPTGNTQAPGGSVGWF